MNFASHQDGDDSGEDYNGGRSLDDLKQFVEDTLNKKCIVGSDKDMKKEDSFCSEKETGEFIMNVVLPYCNHDESELTIPYFVLFVCLASCDMPIEYANKMRSKTDDERKAAIERLDKMKGGSMKPELKLWIFQRLHILNGLQGLSAKDEL